MTDQDKANAAAKQEAALAGPTGGLTVSEVKANQEAASKGLPPPNILGTDEEKKAAKEAYEIAAKAAAEKAKVADANAKVPPGVSVDSVENRLRAVEAKVGIIPPGPIAYDTIDGLPPRFVAGSSTPVNARVK